MAKRTQPMTARQMDRLDSIALRLDALTETVKDDRVRYDLDEASRRLSAALHRAQGLDD